MMKRALCSLRALAALSVVTSWASAGLPAGLSAEGSTAGACADTPVHVVASVLELSPDQLQAWLSILAAKNEAIPPLAEQIQQRRQAIAALLGGGDPDPAAVGRLLIELHALETQVRAIEAQAVMQFRQLLSPPQNLKLEQIRRSAQVCPVVPAFAAVGLVDRPVATRDGQS